MCVRGSVLTFPGEGWGGKGDLNAQPTKSEKDIKMDISDSIEAAQLTSAHRQAAGKQAVVCLTLMDLMLRDLLQKMFRRTSKLETQARSSHPGSSALGGGGPSGKARTVDCMHGQKTAWEDLGSLGLQGQAHGKACSKMAPLSAGLIDTHASPFWAAGAL
ncbi:MAG: hypothetical protein FRX49_06844 [Trebouxia sp. A1-2]|nr:MAG: hypothetical protein FRX49_06844 [Trebouxia sp. A1-2]